MKKRILITIIILIMIFNIAYKQIQRKKIAKIDKQLYELFEPTLKNTTFIIDGERFLFKIKNAELATLKDGYFKRLECDANIDFSVYKNEIKLENLINSAGFNTEVKRKSTEDNFFIDNTKIGSNMTSLFQEFIKVYYFEYKSKEYSSYRGSYNEESIEYDEYGRLIKTGIVHYHGIMYYGNSSMSFDTKFKMKLYGEKLDIKIDVINIIGKGESDESRKY